MIAPSVRDDVTTDRAAYRAVADFLVSRRDAIIDSIVTGRHSGIPKTNRFNENDELLRERVCNWLDLLTRFFLGDEGMCELAGGQISLEYSIPDRPPEEDLVAISAAVNALTAELAGEAEAASPGIRSALAQGLNDVLHHLTVPLEAMTETMLIGDCLMLEIGALASQRTMRAGVGFNAFPIQAHAPMQLVKLMEKPTYKAIFFSPFSHGRTSELIALMQPKAALWSRGKIEALAQQVIEQTQPLLDYLVSHYECPIYVHNAALIPRASTPLKARLAWTATMRQRGIARRRINRWLADYVAMANGRMKNHVQIVDEVAAVERLGGWPAGLYMHTSKFQHATRMSFALADDYADRIEMLSRLHGRKLLVCDLDNTLWDGVIGEGAVTHFVDRQRTLKRLKDNSGVVLSIASKNDPANVHFQGGVLVEEDFVAPQVSWGLKRDAVQRICSTLNLQPRHTAFIDDRADERAIVKGACSDVHVLDATSSKVWRQLSLWADLVEGTSDLDRTALYREQSSRDSFLEDQISDSLGSHADLATQLGLSIDIRQAQSADVKRAVELINRTNQWNMCGSRITLSEVTTSLDACQGHLLVGRASDRFGDMGDVCVALIKRDGPRAEIPILVLSCRVFGYGVETAMLDAIVQLVDLGGKTEQLVGRYIPTTQNHIARNMYTDYGFTAGEEAGSFTLSKSPDQQASPVKTNE